MHHPADCTSGWRGPEGDRAGATPGAVGRQTAHGPGHRRGRAIVLYGPYVCMGAVGVIDGFMRIRRCNSAGLSATGKLLGHAYRGAPRGVEPGGRRTRGIAGVHGAAR
ncbi:hypothetical protein GCM10022220_38590 [Actinocatenispora rupis]|uniref:Uncharacterized protein n=1 Tax=Actinocatenispora rupis TaxID=519421 RepID=A0A8J3NA66_9ACTN|nr:hypothetical protein Aru02nite_29380 [Actinocatenispora rupis]